ncbi:mitochondrial pyruvate carrier 2-like isoform X2 [Amphiura filiformis]|uniref:mitochondrial pyruvate carrier 2-like isoform X2 n=1 Tax=Amphiura filiformis TaxID=82378 RepID=UPI003B20DC9B
MTTSTSGRHCTILVRRFSCGSRCYTSGHSAPTTKSPRFAKLDAKIEKILPLKLKALWNHEAGLKTIFFWAPSWKWVLVFAGLADYARPPEKLSLQQSGALAATGIVWSRYSLAIVPKNWNLFSVNVFVGFTGCMQLVRISLYHRELRLQEHDEDLDPTADSGIFLPPDVAPQQPYF